MKEVEAKEVYDKFKPESSVFVISVDSVDKGGKPNGMICGWQMKCSSEPPLFAVALSKKGNTQNLIRESREFVVAVPNKEMEEDLVFFGSCHGNVVDKFKESSIETEKAKEIKSPLLKKATINMECKLQQEIDAGDHYIFIGEIVASYINEDKKVLFNVGRMDGQRVFKDL